jgi:IS605 OrfB family transposase
MSKPKRPASIGEGSPLYKIWVDIGERGVTFKFHQNLLAAEAPGFSRGEKPRESLSMIPPLDFVSVIAYHWGMKLTLQLQLFPDTSHAARLKATVERFNETADWLAGEAFEIKVANKIQLQKTHYAALRDRFGLSAQMAVRCIAQVCEAYKRDKTIRSRFRKHAAMPFDQRMMSFKGVDRVSLLALDGRMVVPFVMGKYQSERFTNAKGQADLVLRKDGKWFLLVTVDLPEATPTPTTDFLGVDLGLANIATDSDGNAYSGKPVERVRRKHNLQRKRLQRKGTKGARKKLKRLAGKEARFKRHENHVISKAIVETAKGTGRGIAVEDLSGIRDRLPAWGRDARNRLSGWAFGQLVAFLSYKAELAGIPVVKVDPRNTSRTCGECGHCCRANRTSQEKFLCVSCGHRANADQNAARNIRAQAARKTASELVGPRAQPESPAL